MGPPLIGFGNKTIIVRVSELIEVMVALLRSCGSDCEFGREAPGVSVGIKVSGGPRWLRAVASVRAPGLLC